MNKICRICLEEGVLSSIFARNYNLTLCDMIEYCCNIKISQSDGLPDQLCSNCVYKLGIAYHFKQTCESADIRLRQYLGLPLCSKFRDAAMTTDPVIAPTHTIIVKKCKCIKPLKKYTNYKRKSEAEKQKRGPKPKPRPVHSCFECDKEFRCQAQLDMHVRTHTGDRPFACAYCPRRFTQKHNLTIHTRLHTGEKPFQCEICSKRFSAHSNLQTHLKIHTGQKDHTCSLCNKSFITSTGLTRHMSKHRAVKDYKCEQCSAGFVQLRYLKLHKMKKHQMNDEKQDKKNPTQHIDIIETGVTKDLTTKDNDSGVKTLIESQSVPSAIDHKVSNVPITIDHSKDLFNYAPEKHSCTICGEQFEFLSSLGQHCLQRHKSYETMPIVRGFNLS